MRSMPIKKNYKRHIIISAALYLSFASLDSYFTLQGIQGDVSLEGNPIMKFMMQSFGLTMGLVIQKSLIFALAFVMAKITYIGIDKESNWVYYLALTPMTRRWMKRKKRYFVAFLPLYLVAFAQSLAALSWAYILFWSGAAL